MRYVLPFTPAPLSLRLRLPRARAPPEHHRSIEKSLDQCSNLRYAEVRNGSLLFAHTMNGET